MSKISHLITIIILTISVRATGQDIFDKYPEIPKYIVGVNSTLVGLKKVTLENGEFLDNMTDGGGELIGYFKSNAIVKIVLWVGLSYGNEKFEFYFKGDQLYFVLEVFNQFSYNTETDSMDYSKTEMTFRGRYYFGKQFDYLTLGHNRFENDELDPEVVLRNEASEYLDLLKSKL